MAGSAIILVVDDEEMRDVMSRLLAGEGYRVAVAAPGRGARAAQPGTT
jgi:CheY-like chemotaxis protein